MSYIRKAIFISAASVVCLVFTVASAQAENLTNGGEAGLFRLLGSGPLIISESAKGTLEEPATALIPGMGIKIQCQSGGTNEALFITDVRASVEFLFFSCAVYVFKSGELIKNCVIEDVKPQDKMISARGVALPKKHNGKLYVLFDAVRAEIDFAPELGCALPAILEITGSLSAEILEGEPKAQLLTFEEAIQELLGDELIDGELPVKLHGSVAAEIAPGPHAGCGFGVV